MLHKPNGWNSPLNQMSDEEWQGYFRLREEIDVEVSEDEVADAIINMAQRYEISPENLAVSFDKSLSMYLRVQNSKKMLKQKEKKEKK